MSTVPPGGSGTTNLMTVLPAGQSPCADTGVVPARADAVERQTSGEHRACAWVSPPNLDVSDDTRQRSYYQAQHAAGRQARPVSQGVSRLGIGGEKRRDLGARGRTEDATVARALERRRR